MSAHPHETEALLAGAIPNFGSIGIDIKSPDADRPVRLRSFRRNVRRCKISLACGLVVALAAGTTHITSLPLPDVHSSQWLDTARWGADAAIIVLTVGCGCHCTDTSLSAAFSCS